MIIYAVEVRGDITSYEWVIVTIWKNETDALDEMILEYNAIKNLTN